MFLVTALFFVLIGCAWLLYYYLPIGNDYTYFWGFFAMAMILVVLGMHRRPDRRESRSKKAPRRCRAWRSKRRSKIRETVTRGRPPACAQALSAQQTAEGEDLMAQRSAAEIRSSIEANRKELAVSIVKLRGEVTHLTDWRGHLERHQREVKIGGASSSAW